MVLPNATKDQVRVDEKSDFALTLYAEAPYIIIALKYFPALTRFGVSLVSLYLTKH